MGRRESRTRSERFLLRVRNAEAGVVGGGIPDEQSARSRCATPSGILGTLAY